MLSVKEIISRWDSWTISNSMGLSNLHKVLSNMAGRDQTMSQEEWSALRDEVLDLFTPGAPIDEVKLFAGRQSQIQKLRDALSSKGRHAVVYGERGVGKTSLVSIFHLGHAKTSRVHRIYVQCGVHDDFSLIWYKALRRIRFDIDGSSIFADDVLPKIQSADDIEILLSNFRQNDIPIIIFDEFDRIKDVATRRMMSETIKQLSNAPLSGMLIIVGVADSVVQLIKDHRSLSRALVQIRMPRMTGDELREIVASRFQRTRLRISDDALWRITYLSSGLPFYAHALGQSAALMAIDRKTLYVNETILDAAIPHCFSDLDHTILDAYVKATVETRKGNIFKEVIAACSLAEQDELGRFAAADVEAPLTDIMGREMKAPSFSFHLNELCTSERGHLLEKAGLRSHFRFRFVEPMMQPFVTIKSLASNVITNEILIRFSLQRQRQFSI